MDLRPDTMRQGARVRWRSLHTLEVMADEPDLLFHYTNFGGLNGILHSRTVWATDSRYLNDAHEMSYGTSEMSDLLVKIAEELPELTGEDLSKYGTLRSPGKESPDHSDPMALGPANRAVHAAAMTLAAIVDSSIPKFSKDWMLSNGYVTCFTENADSLGQWRGYAGGDGFAIGFRRLALSELTVQCWDYSNGNVDLTSDKWFNNPVPPPQCVDYGDDRRDSALGRAGATLRHYILSHDPVVPFVNFSLAVFTIALRMCMTLKDDAFRDEAEWRLIAAQPYFAKLNFRGGGYGDGGVVPYVQLDYPVEAVERIVIGPGNAPDLRERAVRQMLVSRF